MYLDFVVKVKSQKNQGYVEKWGGGLYQFISFVEIEYENNTDQWSPICDDHWNHSGSFRKY